jgi:hypothetical protein
VAGVRDPLYLLDESDGDEHPLIRMLALGRMVSELGLAMKL